MKKIQKVWMWIFIAMFAIPEILFFTTPSFILSIINNFREVNVNPPIYFFISPQFLIDHQLYTILSLVVEWLGVFGLFMLSMKFNKKLFIILLGIVLLWISLIVFLGYVFSTMSLVS